LLIKPVYKRVLKPKALPKKERQKANATNAAAVTAMAVTAASAMVIVQSVPSVLLSKALRHQPLQAEPTLHQLKLSSSIHAGTLLQLLRLQRQRP
jgi:hypothetical protein